MDYISQLRSWNTLKGYLDKITDPKAKKLYHDSLLLKATDEWGFNPEKLTKVKKTESVELLDYEKDILKRIETCKEYGIDTQTDAEKQKLDKEFRLSMWQFVKNGGKLADLPEYLRCKTIEDAYFQALEKLYIG